MEKIYELENVLTEIEYLADTFCALDIANRSGNVELPRSALSVPADSLKLNVGKAREIYESILNEKGSAHPCG